MKTILERFFEKISHIDQNECWIWSGAKTGTHGQYGGFTFEGKLQQSHRVIWKILVGPIPDKMTIDHLCETTLCQNPDHMELATRGDNSNRGTGATGLNSRKTECLYGHGEYDYISPKGFRSCTVCAKIKAWGRRRGLNMEESLIQYNPSSYIKGRTETETKEARKAQRQLKQQERRNDG